MCNPNVSLDTEYLDVTGLVGDEAAVSTDVSLLAWPEAHPPPAHAALGAPEEGGHYMSQHCPHLQLDVLGNKGVVHVDVELGALLLELPLLGSLDMMQVL